MNAHAPSVVGSRSRTRPRFAAEPLEARTLLAVQVPPGFQEAVFVQDSSPDHNLLGQLTAMTFAPDGRLFVLEKKGNVKIIEDGVVNPTPFFSVQVDGLAERGLDGIELDPDFADNGFVYLYYTTFDAAKPNQAPNAAKNRLIRVTADPANPNLALAGSTVVLVDNIASDTGIHNGGSMHFGPDGMLYVGTGESGTSAYANDLASLNGKILRLNVAAYPASIVPADNPFVATPGARGEVWAYGFRNPFTSGFDPATGKFYVNDVGGTRFEEIDVVTRGGYYGWPQVEGVGGTDFNAIDPIYNYAHLGLNELGQVDSSITGGVLYRRAGLPESTRFPAEYDGKYFFADYARHFIRVLDPATGVADTFVDPSFKDVIDLDVGPDGALYALGYQWRVLKYTFDPTANRRPLVDPPTADVTGGKLPLTVAFGAAATDADNDPLTYAWDFGDGSTGDGAAPSHTYATAGTFAATVTVTDGRGGSTTSEAVNVYPGNRPARIKIKATKTYVAGQQVVFSATAKDPDTGAIDPDTFDWEVVFHHQTHTHPFLDPVDLRDRAGDSFTLGTKFGENDPVQWYRIHVTATDPGGQPVTAFVDVHPKVGRFTLRSSLPGLTLSLDGAPVTGPLPVDAVVGTERTIAAPPAQTLDGVDYEFVEWSDGGAATHAINAPSGRRTLTAVYKAVGPADLAVTGVAVKLPDVLVGGTRGPTARVTINNAGAIDVDATADVALFASTDGTFDGADTELGVLSAATVRLRAGRAKAYKVPVAAVPSLPEADYRVIAVLRDAAGVTDTNPANDSLAADAPAHIAPPVVSLSNDWDGRVRGAQAADGRTRNAAVAVGNAGNTPADGVVRATAYLSADGALDGTDQAIGSADVPVEIAAGRSRRIKVPYAIPSGTTGTFNLLIKIETVAPLTDADATNDVKGSVEAFVLS